MLVMWLAPEFPAVSALGSVSKFLVVLALADLVGLDIILSLANTLYNEFKDPQFAPPVLLSRMVSAGWLGRKKGKGFYEYK
jgi:3-hydroxyacyl-CoA dehydrogenase